MRTALLLGAVVLLNQVVVDRSVLGTQSLEPVRVESRVDSHHSGIAIITNPNTVPLSAYLLEVFVEPCAPMQPRSTLRGVDAAVTPHGQPLGARDKRLETLGSSPCNKTGASTPATAELRAAIFETGATSGEASAVALLLDNRRLVLDQCEALLDRLADANAATVAPEVLTAELRARVAATLEKHPPPFPPTVDLLAFA